MNEDLIVDAIVDGIYDSILDLGDTAYDIALSLQRLGIKGIPEDGESCPIARYIGREFPGWYFEVAAEGVWFYKSGDDATYHVEIELDGFEDFIFSFDEGLYEFLIDD